MDAAAVKRFKDMVERMKAEDLEDYEIYGCLAKYVSDHLDKSTDDRRATDALVVSYLDKHGITLQEIANYVQDGSVGSLLSNDNLASRFASMMDYFEDKGVAAETVFDCLERFIEDGGVNIFTAFGNLMDVDYFNYATVSGYLSSRGIVAESVKDFLEHVLTREPTLVASLRPVADPDFNVQAVGAGLADTLVDMQDLQSTADTRYGDGAAADGGHLAQYNEGLTAHKYSNGMALPIRKGDPARTSLGVDVDSMVMDSPGRMSVGSSRSSFTYSSVGEAMNGVHSDDKFMGWTKEQAEILKQDRAALEALLESHVKGFPGELREVKEQNEVLGSKVSALEQRNERMQEQLNLCEGFHIRLVGELERAVAAAKKGDSKELAALKSSLDQLVSGQMGADARAVYSVSGQEVNSLRSKMDVLAGKLSGSSFPFRTMSRHRSKKDRTFTSFDDILQALDDMDREVEQLRDENSFTMKQLVLKKVELAETQEEVTKTKRALIRAVNKQMQLAYKIDEMRQMYLSVVSRQGQRFAPRAFGRTRSTVAS